MITVILKRGPNRTYEIGTLRLKTTQLLNNEALEFPAFWQSRAGQGEDIIRHPTYKDNDEVSQIDSSRFCLPGQSQFFTQRLTLCLLLRTSILACRS